MFKTKKEPAIFEMVDPSVKLPWPDREKDKKTIARLVQLRGRLHGMAQNAAGERKKKIRKLIKAVNEEIETLAILDKILY